jgi:hypothetical protein
MYVWMFARNYFEWELKAAAGSVGVPVKERRVTGGILLNEGEV